MLADPQSITVATVAKSMPRILNEGTHSLYRMSDLTYSLDVRHRTVVRNKKRRTVSLVSFSHQKMVTNPLDQTNDYESSTWSVQNDRPEVGFTNTELKDDLAGFQTWYNAAMVDKIVGQES